jgi:acetoin utilization deacetylase AcuC-like enzyme
MKVYKADAIVMQCGADGLAFDRLGEWNLDIEDISKCVRFILNFNIPTLLLGGGGYNHANAGRLWTKLTAVAVNTDISNEIPEHSYWDLYGPGFNHLI